MDISSRFRANSLRRTPLALCLGFAFALGANSSFAEVAKHEWSPAPIALSPAKLEGLQNQRRPEPNHVATTYLVTNCDDSGSDSLRDASTHAVSGDTIDVSELPCSTISLTSGSVGLNGGVILKGPGADLLDISAAGNANKAAFYGFGDIFIQDVTVSGAKYLGTLGEGGCIWSSGSVALTSARVTGCQVITPSDSTYSARGGGVFATGNLTLIDSVIDHNTVEGYNTTGLGGGAYAKGGIVSKYSTIDGNDATSTNSRGYGGGLFIAGGANAYFGNSTISNNGASGFNGGFEARDSSGSSTFTMINSTISGNRANIIQGGGSVYMQPYLANSTVAFNTAPTDDYAVGLYVKPVGQIESSIFSNNMADDGSTYDLQSINGVFTGHNNLITATGSSVPLGTLSDCPNLGPLADNGGMTMTHSIGLDSAALDQGNDESGILHDQRGEVRPFGAAPDIGSYENQGERGDRIFMNGVDSICQ
jgi:hypothetical protein